MVEDFIRRRRLKSPQLGVAAGLSLGLYAAIMTICAYYFPPFAQGLTACFANLFPHYSVSYLGALVVFLGVFLDVFLVVWLMGTLYNALTQAGYGCRRWAELKSDQGIEKTDNGERKSTNG